MVYSTSDPIDTYVAAGIAIQCAGMDEWWNSDSGLGYAQVSKDQAETEYGEPIYERKNNGDIVYEDGKPTVRAYGLRLKCPDGSLEQVLDPNNTRDAVILMKRRLQLVIDECKKCTDTDKYIAAALAQNSPGFTHINMKNDVPTVRPKDGNGDISKDWDLWFLRGQQKNNQDQLYRFNLVIAELTGCFFESISLCIFLHVVLVT